MVTSEKRKWLALALLSAVQFMVVLDIAIVNVALPSIKVDLGFSQANLQWVISAYALVFGGFLLLGGRVADIAGRRRMFFIGTTVFTIASLLAGLAWSEPSLITARSLQGLGAAIITPAALSILSTTFVEGRERNIALGVWGAVGGFGAAAGVLLGGILTDLLSWEWIFFINVPVGAAAFLLTPRLLSESRDARVKSFDAQGAVLVTGGLSALVYAITQAGQIGWLAGRTVGFFAGGLALLAAFVAWERRHAEPLMRFGILRTRTVMGANVAGFILGTATFSMFLMLTLYMQQVLGYSPLRTGIAYLAVAGTAILWSAVAAQLVTRVGVKPVLVAGMAALTGGVLYFTQVSVGGSYLGDLLPGFLLVAIGIGFIIGGAILAYRGAKTKFEKKLKTHQMSHAMRSFVEKVGMAGMVARGIIAALIGIFLIQAALTFNPKKAKGLDGSLRALADHGWGKVLLVFIAIGLVAFGLYSFAEARYRRTGKEGGAGSGTTAPYPSAAAHRGATVRTD
jgi:EmrB/QacA subfamily drug resistance transporter